MTPSLRSAMERAATGAKRAVVATPVEVALGLAMAAVLSAGIAADEPVVWDHVERATLTGLLLLAGAFAMSSLEALGAVDHGTRWGGTAAVGAVGGAYAWLVLDVHRTAELWRWGLLASSLGFGILLLPLAAPRPPMGRRALLWRFDTRLVVRLLATLLYTVAMYVGLSLALVAVDSLFHLDLDGDVYGHLASAVFVGGGIWIAVAGLPHLADATTPLSDGARAAAARLGRWLFAPLLIVYMLILYAYTVRVIVTKELPSNLLSPLALGAAALGLIGLFVVDPLHRDGEHRVLSAGARWFPVAYLPMVPLTVWALWQRVAQHGWTEFRYVRLAVVVAVTIGFAVAAVRLARRASSPLAMYPAIFAAMALLAGLGPWGAVSVSKRSQLTRLTRGLRSAHLLHRGKIDVAKAKALGHDAPGPELASEVRYLFDHHGARSIASLMPASVRPNAWLDGWGMASLLGLKPGQEPHTFDVETLGPFSIGGPGHLYRAGAVEDASSIDALSVAVDGTVLSVESRDGRSWHADLARVVARATGLAKREPRLDTVKIPASGAKLELLDEHGIPQGVVLLEGLTVEVKGAAERVSDVRGLVWVPANASEAPAP